MKDLTFAVFNHGCKLNQYEGEALTQSFINAGFRPVNLGESSAVDVVVVNTCTVTEKSDRKSRHSILKASRQKRDGGLLVVTGCYAETDRETLSKIDGVDMVVGTGDKPRIVEMVQSRLAGVSAHFDSSVSPFCYTAVENPRRSRAFVKVQDGCDMRCAYCKVPLARGSSVSRETNEIVSSIARLVANGYREVVLTGINLGDYRYGTNRLSDLVRILLQSTKGIRIRLSSIEPAFFESTLFDVIEDERVAPHFHIPLQSGSDRILKVMNRPYTVKDYMGIIEGIRHKRPESHIATDLIVGFPTENRRDFNSTVNVIREVDFASMHVFRYSVRTGTNGAKLRDDVAYEDKSSRSKKLIGLGKELNRKYRERFIGTHRKTVLETHGNLVQGITDNYIRVTLEDTVSSVGLVTVLVTRVEDDVTWARI